MDYKTKTYYRSKIKEISKRTKISELYITQKALELAISNATQQMDNLHNADTHVGAGPVSAQENGNQLDANTNKQSHIGYYLIDEGINELYKTIQTNKKPKKAKNNVPLYILSITILSISISSIISYCIFKQTNIILAIITFLLTFIPSSQISTDIIQYILNKIVKPSLIPKMDFSNRSTRRMYYNGYNSKHSKIAKQSKRLNFKTRSFLPCQ